MFAVPDLKTWTLSANKSNLNRTPLSRGTKQLKRTPFTRKIPIGATIGIRRSRLTAHARLKRAKTPLRASKPRKPKSPLWKLKKALWDECRRITRARYGNTCYTCGRTGLEGSNWQTGHYISSSICSVFLRYHLDNLRPQCYSCNINKSGNWIAFEAHLTIDMGADFPEQLKQLNRDTIGKQYDVLYYEGKLAEYRMLQ